MKIPTFPIFQDVARAALDTPNARIFLGKLHCRLALELRAVGMTLGVWLAQDGIDGPDLAVSRYALRVVDPLSFEVYEVLLSLGLHRMPTGDCSLVATSEIRIIRTGMLFVRCESLHGQWLGRDLALLPAGLSQAFDELARDASDGGGEDFMKLAQALSSAEAP